MEQIDRANEKLLDEYLSQDFSADNEYSCPNCFEVFKDDGDLETNRWGDKICPDCDCEMEEYNGN